MTSALFLAMRAGAWLPAAITVPVRVALVVWLVADLPIALRRAYGGSRLMTGVKLAGSEFRISACSCSSACRRSRS